MVNLREGYESKLQKQKQKYKEQMRGLKIDIKFYRILKDRENCFREDLKYQKKYLLLMLGGHEAV
jgi:hypothetical protein